MTPAFTARRRAEEFNSLVEGSSSTSELTRARYVDVLELVEAMRHAAPVEPRPAFVADLRERLMAAADAALAPATDAELRARLTVAPRRTPRERRIAVAIGGFAIVGATTSMAVAAQTALPGDTLYPLKRALENAHAGVQVDEGDKGETMLSNASGRLDEVDELSRTSADLDGVVIAETLQAFTDQATAASDLLIASYESTGQEGSIADLRSFAADSIAALQELEGVVPDGARAALIQAVQVLSQIDEQALYACPTCAPGGPVSIPQSLLDHVASTVNGGSGPESAPAVGNPDGKAKGDKGKGGKPEGSKPPPAGTDDQPGTDTPPVQQPGGNGGNNDGETDDPIGDITDGLTGGAGSLPSTLPELGEVLGDVIEDVTSPLVP